MHVKHITSSDLIVLPFKSDVINITFLLTILLRNLDKRLWELTKVSLEGNYLILKQTFLINSLRKCMEISVENLYVDIAG